MTVAQRAKADYSEFERAIRRRRNHHYKQQLSAIRTMLQSQYEPVLQMLNIGVMPSTANAFIRRDTIQQMYVDLYSSVGVDFAKLANRSMKSYAGELLLKDEADELANSWLDRVRLYVMNEAADRVTNVTQTTIDDLRRIIGIAIEEGYGAEESARFISREMGQISLRRARVIARTEILTASNYGQHLGYRSLNMELERTWLTARDERVRDERFNHRSANGQKRALEEPFLVSGERMLHPGDSTLGASAGNLIQCRCVATAVPK